MGKKLYEEKLEAYPLKPVIGQDIFFIIYFRLGTAGLWDLKIRGIPVVFETEWNNMEIVTREVHALNVR